MRVDDIFFKAGKGGQITNLRSIKHGHTNSSIGLSPCDIARQDSENFLASFKRAFNTGISGKIWADLEFSTNFVNGV